MESINNSIKISDLKNVLFEKVNAFFVNQGFRSNKGHMKFLKETQTSSIEFLFEFSSYYPIHNEYHFKCFIFLKELDLIIKEYQEFTSIHQKILFHVLIVEGEFINELLNKDRKFSRSYVNEVDTIQNVEISIKQTLDILKNDALPKAYDLSNLIGFQKYFFDYPERIAGRITDNSFILSCLMAAYMVSEEFYLVTSDLIKKELDKCKATGLDLPSSYSIITCMNSFIEYKKENPQLSN